MNTTPIIPIVPVTPHRVSPDPMAPIGPIVPMPVNPIRITPEIMQAVEKERQRMGLSVLRITLSDGFQETTLFQTSDPEQIQQAKAWVDSLIKHLHGFEPKKGGIGQPWRVWSPAHPAGTSVGSIAELTRVVGCTRESITSALTRRRNAPFLPPEGLAVPPGIAGYAVKGCFFCRLEDWVRHVQNPPR